MREVHVHDSSLKAYLRGSFPGVRDVDDVVQESYLRVWKTCAIQSIRSARGFLFQVARRLALDALRHGRAVQFENEMTLAESDLMATDSDAASTAIVRESRRLLIDIVASLPPGCRRIVVMRKFEGIPQKEVAARLGISERAVEGRLARGLRRCERALREHGLAGNCVP